MLPACLPRSAALPDRIRPAVSRRHALLWQLFELRPADRELKTCASLSKLTRHQRSSTHDLPSFFAHRWNNRGRISCFTRFDWIFGTGFRQSRETLSAVLRCGSQPAYHLSALDFLAALHDPHGRILRFTAAAPHFLADPLRSLPALRRCISC